MVNHSDARALKRARLTLFGYAPTEAKTEFRPRPRSERLTRALLYSGGWILVTPVVALIPLHVPWALGALGAAGYFGWSHWRGTYEVKHFEAACPACGEPLTLKPGTRLRLPFGLTCMGCHRESTLDSGGEPPETVLDPEPRTT